MHYLTASKIPQIKLTYLRIRASRSKYTWIISKSNITNLLIMRYQLLYNLLLMNIPYSTSLINTRRSNYIRAIPMPIKACQRPTMLRRSFINQRRNKCWLIILINTSQTHDISRSCQPVIPALINWISHNFCRWVHMLEFR